MSVLAEIDGENVLIAGDALPESGTVARGIPYNIFWDTEDAYASVEKMVASSNVFYPGHDRPFRVEGDEIAYLHGPANIEVMNSTEGGGHDIADLYGQRSTDGKRRHGPEAAGVE